MWCLLFGQRCREMETNLQNKSLDGCKCWCKVTSFVSFESWVLALFFSAFLTLLGLGLSLIAICQGEIIAAVQVKQNVVATCMRSHMNMRKSRRLCIIVACCSGKLPVRCSSMHANQQLLWFLVQSSCFFVYMELPMITFFFFFNGAMITLWLLHYCWCV